MNLAVSRGASSLLTISFKVTVLPFIPMSCRRLWTSFDKSLINLSASISFKIILKNLLIVKLNIWGLFSLKSICFLKVSLVFIYIIWQRSLLHVLRHLFGPYWFESYPIIHFCWHWLPFLVCLDLSVILAPATPEQGHSCLRTKLLLQGRLGYLL